MTNFGEDDMIQAVNSNHPGRERKGRDSDAEETVEPNTTNTKEAFLCGATSGSTSSAS